MATACLRESHGPISSYRSRPGRGNVKRPPFKPGIEFPDEPDQVVCIYSIVGLIPGINRIVVVGNNKNGICQKD